MRASEHFKTNPYGARQKKEKTKARNTSPGRHLGEYDDVHRTFRLVSRRCMRVCPKYLIFLVEPYSALRAKLFVIRIRQASLNVFQT